ncbi:hypothetical protein [Streptomyces sp. NPDC047043]
MTRAGDEAVLRIAEGLEQFVGERRGGLEQTTTAIGDVVEENRRR